MGDGWLPSFCTPDDAVAGRVVVEKAAADAGRAIDPEHFGALVIYTRRELPERLAPRHRGAPARRRPRRARPASLPDGARHRIERFIAGGFSKFVLVPAEEPASWSDELAEVAAELLPLRPERHARAEDAVDGDLDGDPLGIGPGLAVALGVAPHGLGDGFGVGSDPALALEREPASDRRSGTARLDRPRPRCAP